MRSWALIVLLSAGCGPAAHAPSIKTANDGGLDVEPDGGTADLERPEVKAGPDVNANDGPADVRGADAAGEDAPTRAETSVACRAAGSGGGGASTEVVPANACPDPVGFTGADICPPDHGLGVVLASQGSALGPSWLDANFLPFNGCQTFGACSVIPYSPPPAVRPQAGQITAVSGPSTITMEPDPSTGAYNPTELAGPRPLWTPGTLVTFSAAGGSIPQFVGGFCGPAPVTITSPIHAYDLVAMIDRSQDLTIKWTGTGPGVVQVQIVPFSMSSQNFTGAVCYYPVASMSGIVPKEVLQMFPAGTQSISFEHVVRKTVTVGDSCVELDASIPAVNASGEELDSVRATFQ
jgi:hypothetical protein